MQKETTLSKKINDKISINLTTILRHEAIKMGLNMDNQGFVSIKQIIPKMQEIKSLKNLTLDQIQEVVNTSSKNRFTLIQRQGQWMIRANQGHSISGLNSDLLLQQIDLIDVEKYYKVIHATYQKVWPMIQKQGIKIMNRIHLHFRPWAKDQFIIRNDCDLYIAIDITQALKDGIKFYISKNGDILSQGDSDHRISQKYFLQVMDSKGSAIKN